MLKTTEIIIKERKRRIACACLLFFIAANKEEHKLKRSVWTKSYLLRRKYSGMHHNLFLELALEDLNRFRR